jgi:hypothetical protein
MDYGDTQEANCLLSARANLFEHMGPESLKGDTMAGLVGYRYLGLDKLINSANITRLTTRKLIKRHGLYTRVFLLCCFT